MKSFDYFLLKIIVLTIILMKIYNLLHFWPHYNPQIKYKNSPPSVLYLTLYLTEVHTFKSEVHFWWGVGVYSYFKPKFIKVSELSIAWNIMNTKNVIHKLCHMTIFISTYVTAKIKLWASSLIFLHQKILSWA